MVAPHSDAWLHQRRYVRQVLRAEAQLAHERALLRCGIRPRGTWLLAQELLRAVAANGIGITISAGCDALDLDPSEVRAVAQCMWPHLVVTSHLVRGEEQVLAEILATLEDPCPPLAVPDPLPVEGGRSWAETSGSRPCPKCGERLGYRDGPCGKCFWQEVPPATPWRRRPLRPTPTPAQPRERVCLVCREVFMATNGRSRYCPPPKFCRRAAESRRDQARDRRRGVLA